MEKGSLNEQEVNELIVKEFIKNGYSKSNGNKNWAIVQRKFLYLTPELAKGFLQLKNYKIYHEQVTEPELMLLKQNADKISRGAGYGRINLIDMYCGDGTKAVEFIKMLSRDARITYCPVNANSHLTDLAVRNVKAGDFNNVVDYRPVACTNSNDLDLNIVLDRLNEKAYDKNVILLLGSVLASYEINSYLFELSRDMKKTDFLVIGNGIRAGERLVGLDKYKDPYFSQWFMHLMGGLGFKDNEVEYDARFGNSRVEMFYKIRADKSIKEGDIKIDFKKGDEILIAVLYKYYEEEFDKFCRMYFSDVSISTDNDKGYALVMCKK